MAKLKKTASFKNVLIDSRDPMTIQEFNKECTYYYNLEKIALEFADKPGVSITFSWDDELESEEDPTDE